MGSVRGGEGGGGGILKHSDKYGFDCIRSRTAADDSLFLLHSLHCL